MFEEQVPDIFFVIFGILFILAALVRLLIPGYLQGLIEALWNSNLLDIQVREGKVQFWGVQLLGDLIFISSLSLFGMLILDSPTTEAFISLFVIILSFYAIRILLIKGFGYLFFGGTDEGRHEAEVILFNRLVGLLMLVVCFLMFYVEIPWRSWAVTIISVFLITIWLWRFLRIFQRLWGIGRYGFFYILLYLCTLEISPFVLLIKVLISS